MSSDQVLLQQVKTLLDQKQWESAQILASFLLNSNSSHPTTLIEAQMYYSMATCHKGEHKRAIKYLQGALELVMKQNASWTVQNNKKERPISTLEAEIRFSMARCYLHANEQAIADAISILKVVPIQMRPLDLQMIFAKFYHFYLHDKKEALLSYIEVLKKNPLCIEAAYAILDLSLPFAELLTTLQSISQSTNVSIPEWFISLLTARANEAKFDYDGAVESFGQIEKKFNQTNNLYLCKSLALCSLQQGNMEKSKQYFEQIRRADSLFLDGMDGYAVVLKAHAQTMELNKLATTMAMATDSRAETWTTWSNYFSLMNDKEKASAFLLRAIELEPHHVTTLLMQGEMNLLDGRPERAISYFRNAHSIQKTYFSYSGLVRSSLGAKKHREALQMAAELRAMMPTNPKSITLMADVLAASEEPSDRKKAKEQFEEALKINPSCLEAIMGVAKLMEEEDQVGKAIDFLKARIAIYAERNREFLHERLANLYVKKTEFKDARTHFETALALNPAFEIARAGLKKLDKTISGDNEERETQNNDDVEDDDHE